MSDSLWTGQVVVIAWPPTDDQQARKWPVLVISEPDHQGDLCLLKISSQSHHELSVAVSQADLEEGVLKQTAYIRIEHTITVHRSRLEPINVRLKPGKLAEVHRALALMHTRSFSRLRHAPFRPATDPGRSADAAGRAIPYAGRVFSDDEVVAAVDSSLEFCWLSAPSPRR